MAVETFEEALARRFFEEEHLEVVRIPTAPTPTADYFVNGDGPGYVVEVKTRNDDPSTVRRLKQGQVVAGAGEAAFDAALERVARDARKQCREVDAEHERIWLLWFSLGAILGSDASLDQCVGTLYGVRPCVYEGQGGTAVSTDCYYARPGVFERWTELDGAIIAAAGGFLMFANELSPRFDVLRDRVAHSTSQRSWMVVERF